MLVNKSRRKKWTWLSIGGEKDTAIWQLNLQDTEWTQLDVQISYWTESAAAVQLKSIIYLIGGQSEGRSIGSVLLLDLQEMKWSEGPTLKEIRSYHSAIVDWDGDSILVIGGCIRSYLDSVEELSLGGSSEWKLIAPISQARSLLTSLLFTFPTSNEKYVLAVGGSFSNKVDCLNGRREWANLPDMISRNHVLPAAFQSESRLFVFSSEGGGEYFDTQTNVWTLLTNPPEDFNYCRAKIPLTMEEDGCFYSLQGSQGNCSTWRYNPRDDQWTKVEGTEKQLAPNSTFLALDL